MLAFIGIDWNIALTKHLSLFISGPEHNSLSEGRRPAHDRHDGRHSAEEEELQRSTWAVSRQHRFPRIRKPPRTSSRSSLLDASLLCRCQVQEPGMWQLMYRTQKSRQGPNINFYGIFRTNNTPWYILPTVSRYAAKKRDLNIHGFLFYTKKSKDQSFFKEYFWSTLWWLRVSEVQYVPAVVILYVLMTICSSV